MVRFPCGKVPWASALLLAACGDTGREHVTLTLRHRGAPARDVPIDGAVLRLTSARLAFGPLYLCATKSAESELCETAIAEFLETKTFDALAGEVGSLGELDGTTGTIRSGFFDYGISWPLTKQAPAANEGTVQGHSALLTFRATAEDGTTLDVEANIDVLPLVPGDAAVNGLKTQHDVAGDEDEVTLVVDPSTWLRRVKLDRLLELDTDGDGRVVLERGSQPYEAILQGMTVNAPAGFEWTPGS